MQHTIDAITAEYRQRQIREEVAEARLAAQLTATRGNGWLARVAGHLRIRPAAG